MKKVTIYTDRWVPVRVEKTDTGTKVTPVDHEWIDGLFTRGYRVTDSEQTEGGLKLTLEKS